MKERIKAYTIHLSANAYQDRSENAPSDSVHTLAQRAYEPFTVKEPALFRELVDRAAEGGVNTRVVAVLDALAYESHPELALPGAWTREELKEQGLVVSRRGHSCGLRVRVPERRPALAGF